MEGIEAVLVEKYALLVPYLDERRRLLLGADSRVLGAWRDPAGGACGRVSEETVSRGAAELEAGELPSQRSAVWAGATRARARASATGGRPAGAGRA